MQYPETLNQSIGTATIIMGGFLLLLLVSTLLMSYRKSRLKRFEARLRPLFEEILEQVIVFGADIDGTQESAWYNGELLKKLPVQPKARKLLMQMTCDAIPALSGEARENLRTFARHAGMQDLAASGLRSRGLNRRIEAVQQLGLLGATEFVKPIFYLSNAADETLRQAAQLALVRLKGYRGLRFLRILNKPLSEWQQICLLQLLSEETQLDFSRLPLWLRSPNESVQYFAIRLIREYSLFEQHDDLLPMLQSPSHRIRLLTAETLASIYQSNTSEALVKGYQQAADAEERIAVVDALGRIGDEHACQFLKTLVNRCAGREKLHLVTAFLRAGISMNQLMMPTEASGELALMLAHAQNEMNQ